MMSQPKKVAIIGAGPSGLVMAKTLLHQFPEGTFAPTIFEKRHEIGGLWPVQQSRKSSSTVNPSMRTNQSRFTVSFSDLAWESVVGDDVPDFPRAWQVGRYLEVYAERFLPDGVVRLGHEVVRTFRERVGGRPRWTVEWSRTKSPGDDQSETGVVGKEHFDFLVVTSGYFSRPYCPEIPGLAAFSDRTVHSFALRGEEDFNNLVAKAGASGKLVVIGGSMSGVEVASALALHVSSLKAASGSTLAAGTPEIHHVCSRPFWTVPTYLPHVRRQGETSTEVVSFLPLDLAMHDLVLRPPGPAEYPLPPASSAKIAKVNEYFHSLLGDDYASIRASGPAAYDAEGKGMRPSWLAIGNDYAEFVRSGAIKNTYGRVCAVHRPSADRARIDVELPGKDMVSLENVTAVVLATGFTPVLSLTFLPEEILSKLEYSPTDLSFPLVLDGKGTAHAEIPDLGFVGFYRGPFWGVMEMQARSVASTWARALTEHGIQFSTEELERKAQERQRVREARHAVPDSHRGQFPMADYIGLMESYAQDLGIRRVPLLELEGRTGPIFPARYTMPSVRDERGLEAADLQTTLKALRDSLFPQPGGTSPAASMAIFRALHGSWSFRRISPGQGTETTGVATFHPRYPAEPAYEKEYLYEETGPEPMRFVYRLPDSPRDARILVWSVDETQDQAAAAFSHALSVTGQEFQSDQAGFAVHATGSDKAGVASDHSTISNCRYQYVFRFDGVAISSWECTMWQCPSDGTELYKTIYRRP